MPKPTTMQSDYVVSHHGDTVILMMDKRTAQALAEVLGHFRFGTSLPNPVDLDPDYIHRFGPGAPDLEYAIGGGEFQDASPNLTLRMVVRT